MPTPPNSGFHRLGELLQVLGADVVGVRVELFEHPLHRRLDELLAIDVLHVVAVDLLEGVDEHLHQLVVLFRRRLLLFGDDRGETAKQHDASQQGDESITTHVTGSRSDRALWAFDQTLRQRRQTPDSSETAEFPVAVDTQYPM